MKRIIIISILISISLWMFAQSDIPGKWDQSIIDKANTAKDFQFYSEEEKNVVLIMNLARLDGELFAETILKEYVEENRVEQNGYLRTLYRDLKKVKNLPVLMPAEDLTSIAQGHANKCGRKGIVGHTDFDKRFEPYMGNPYYNVAENCSYGYSAALDIVITLLIDDGINNLGHRKNTLNELFNSVGVAIRPHKSYRHNCVIDFGKR